MTSPAYAGSGNGPGERGSSRASDHEDLGSHGGGSPTTTAWPRWILSTTHRAVEANRQRATACRLPAQAGGVCEPPADGALSIPRPPGEFITITTADVEIPTLGRQLEHTR